MSVIEDNVVVVAFWFGEKQVFFSRGRSFSCKCNVLNVIAGLWVVRASKAYRTRREQTVAQPHDKYNNHSANNVLYYIHPTSRTTQPNHNPHTKLQIQHRK